MKWALLAVTVAAGAVRLYGLGDCHLWLDEVLAWRMSGFPFSEMLGRLANPAEGDNPPLYFLLLKLWREVAGDGEYALRLPSAVFGILAVPAAYGMTRAICRLASPSTPAWPWSPLLAAVLVAFSEEQVSLSRQARMYSLGVLLTCLSGWAVCSGLSRPGRGGRLAWASYAVSAAALCYTHNVGLFIVAAQLLFAGWFVWDTTPARDGNSLGEKVTDLWYRGAGVIVAGVLIGLAYVPQMLLLAERADASSAANDWMGELQLKPVSQAILEVFLSEKAAKQVSGSEGGCYTALAAVALVCWRFTGVKWAGRYAAVIVAVTGAALLIYSTRSATNLFQPRYLIFAQIGWLVGLAVLPVTVRQGLRPVVGVGLVLGWANLFAPCLEGVVSQEASPGMREVAARIVANRRSDELVVTQNYYVFLKLTYYLRGTAIQPVLCDLLANRRLLRQADYLTDDDVVSPDYLAAAGRNGFWHASSRSHRDRPEVRFPLPGRWRQVEATIVNEQDWSFEGPVRLSRYTRE